MPRFHRPFRSPLLTACLLVVTAACGLACADDPGAEALHAASRQPGSLVEHAGEAPPQSASAPTPTLAPDPTPAPSAPHVVNLGGGVPLPEPPPDEEDHLAALEHLLGSEEEDDLGDVPIFTTVDQMPVIQDEVLPLTIDIAGADAQAGTTERVLVEFVVDAVGRVRQPKTRQGARSECAVLAPLVLQDVVFTPGLQDGRPVHVRTTLSLTCNYY